MANVCLALSGGGLRATFFHLGVIAALREIGLLKQVTEIASVSGGSILAPHLVLNWQAYAHGTEEEFDRCYQELAKLSDRNIRNRVLVGAILKYVLIFPVVIPRLLPNSFKRLLSYLRRAVLRDWLATPLGFCDRCFDWGTGDWLVSEYSNALFQQNETLANLKNGGPHLSILATSLTTGQIVAHCSDGIGFYPASEGNAPFTDQVDYPLARAVAASSAFPPAFSPIELIAEEVGLRENVQGLNHWLTDGGIHDNTGVVWLRHGSPKRSAAGGAIDLLIVSNAGRPFDQLWQRGAAMLETVWRNMRANEIAAGRMEKHDLDDLPTAPYACLAITLNDRYPVNFEEGALQPARQLQVESTRTDLGGFERALLEMVSRHGYLLTKFKVRKAME